MGKVHVAAQFGTAFTLIPVPVCYSLIAKPDRIEVAVTVGPSLAVDPSHS